MSVTLRNISGLGDLDIAGVGFIEAGATFDVDDEIGESLAHQEANFEVVTTKKPKTTAPAVTDTTTGA